MSGEADAKIAVIGPGGIGSTFAFQLALAGHDVTVVARGERLKQLSRDEAIVSVAGKRAPVQASATLDGKTPWDLVLVTVLASQVNAVLPALSACAAQRVMFMFNTFESLPAPAPRRPKVAFGFPAILASIDDGKLRAKIMTQGQLTTATDENWAKIHQIAYLWRG